jgi:small conductance mechanosensitive channel
MFIIPSPEKTKENDNLLLEIFDIYPVVRSVSRAVILLVVGILMIRIVGKVLKTSLEKTRLEKAAHSLITSLANATMYVLLGLTVASSLGIDVTSIVALASVLTLAFSLALQNMVSNIIGGFTILYTQPFHSGDYVEIAGQGGTVKEINMTYTMLATADNKLISIPNSAVVAAQIVNYSAAETRRVEVVVTASYDAPTRKVIDALILAGSVEDVLPDPAPAAVVTAYGDSAISYSLRLWVKTPDYWDVYFLVNQRVKDVFDAQGIEMTYPHLNVHIQP